MLAAAPRRGACCHSSPAPLPFRGVPAYWGSETKLSRPWAPPGSVPAGVATPCEVCRARPLSGCLPGLRGCSFRRCAVGPVTQRDLRRARLWEVVVWNRGRALAAAARQEWAENRITITAAQSAHVRSRAVTPHMPVTRVWRSLSHPTRQDSIMYISCPIDPRPTSIAPHLMPKRPPFTPTGLQSVQS